MLIIGLCPLATTIINDETLPVIYCDTVNRGLAYGDGKIFLNQADTTLAALDMNTGQLIWSDKRDDPKRGATSTGAAFVMKDKVLVGISGSEFGIRGYMQTHLLILNSLELPHPVQKIHFILTSSLVSIKLCFLL